MANKFILAGGGAAAVLVAGIWIGNSTSTPEMGSLRCGPEAHIKNDRHNDMKDLIGRAATAAKVEFDTTKVLNNAMIEYRNLSGNQDPNALPAAIGMRICSIVKPSDPSQEPSPVSYQLFMHGLEAQPPTASAPSPSGRK
jgi:hypothetical protein